MKDEILARVGCRRGHFAYESGHHGDLWFDLETLCQRPRELQPLLRALVDRLQPYQPEIICGPLVEGAFVSLLVAEILGCGFVYVNRFANDTDLADALFPIRYRLPHSLQALVRNKRVAIINDVINAGSAVRGAFEDLVSHGANVVVIGALLVLGDTFQAFARTHSIRVEALATMPNHLWTPQECPLCAKSVVLEQLAIA